MWTDGKVFRSYGAQKADLKGVDFFFFPSSSGIACILSHEGNAESFLLGTAPVQMEWSGGGGQKILGLDHKVSPVNGLLKFARLMAKSS